MPQRGEIINLTGQRFGRWLVLSRSGSGTHPTLWQCVCSCGKTKIVARSTLRNGASKSCGCLHKEICSTHGLHRSPTYAIWEGIIQRCTNPRDKAWKYYGGRGIAVCGRWKKFQHFLNDMGLRPAGMQGKRAAYTIERSNNNGNYEPGNCRWATWKEQSANKRVTYHAAESA